MEQQELEALEAELGLGNMDEETEAALHELLDDGLTDAMKEAKAEEDLCFAGFDAHLDFSKPLGMRLNADLVVAKVTPGGQAQAVGLYPGCKLLALGEQYASTSGDFSALLRTFKGHGRAGADVKFQDIRREKHARAEYARARAEVSAELHRVAEREHAEAEARAEASMQAHAALQGRHSEEREVASAAAKRLEEEMAEARREALAEEARAREALAHQRAEAEERQYDLHRSNEAANERARFDEELRLERRMVREDRLLLELERASREWRASRGGLLEGVCRLARPLGMEIDQRNVRAPPRHSEPTCTQLEEGDGGGGADHFELAGDDLKLMFVAACVFLPGGVGGDRGAVGRVQGGRGR